MDTPLQLQQNLAIVQGALKDLSENLKGFFGRPSNHATACHYLQGLLSSVERKNSWQIAEEEGLHDPYCLQYLLNRAHWDADQVRDAHMQQVKRGLGDKDGTLIVDETGFLKKGKESAGVARQYSGTAGRIENCQIGVFLGWAAQRGSTLIDRELYVPKEWYEDTQRCRRVHISEDRVFLTKLDLAQQMIERALQAGFQPSWTTADEVYGKSYSFRSFLEERHLSYVVAVPKNQSICRGFDKSPAYTVLSSLKEEDWVTLSCGLGSKGPRDYQWACLSLNCPNPEYRRWLLLRRSLNNPDDIAYYLVFAPPHTSLADIVQAAGQRWHIEECFQSAKGEVGLDQYEVRNYTGWYRHITLSMLAHALLVMTKSHILPPSHPGSSMVEFKKKRGLL
jgi:SRSO17 transposase